MTVALNSPAGSRAIGPRTAAGLAWLACGLALLLLAAGLVLLWASPDGPLAEGDRSRLDQAINLVSLLGPPLLGGLLASRRPSNPYGWLWVAYGLGWTVVGFPNASVTYVSASGTEALSSNTTGDDNTATGVGALSSNTEGFNNTASGANALRRVLTPPGI